MAQLQSTAVTGSLIVTGDITAQTLVVQTITSSVLYSSGSNTFGNQLTNVQAFTGSLRVTGSGPHYVMGGDVGIGTTNPSDKLTILGSSATTFEGGGIYNSYTYGNSDKAESRFNLGKLEGTTYQPMGAIGAFPISNTSSTNGILSFYTRTSQNVTEKMRIDSSGNVGVGTTDPQGKLHVFGGNFIRSNSDYVAGSVGSGFLIIPGASSGDTYSQIYAFQSGNTAYANLVIPGGNVGIGTTNPGNKLEVDGGLAYFKQIASAGSAFRWGSYGTAVSPDTMLCMNQLWNGSSFTILESSYGTTAINLGSAVASPDIVFQTGPANTVATTKMIITNAGNVGIGNTSPSTFSGGGLSIGSATTGKNLMMYSSTAGSNGLIQFFDTASANALQIGANTSNFYLYGYGSRSFSLFTNESERITVLSNGNVGINTTNPQTGVILDARGAAAVAGGIEGLRIGSVGDNSSYDNIKIYYTGYNGGAPRVYLTPRTTPGSGIVETYLHLQNTNGSSTTSNNTIGLLVDGNVGIGTTNPGHKLDVSGSGRFIFRNASSEIMDLVVSTETASPSKSKIALNWYGNETAAVKFTRGGDATGGELEFWTQQEGGSILERMTILSSGNVGIGTTSPSAILHTAGNTKLGGGTFQASTDQTFTTNYSYTFRDAVGINNPNSLSAASATTVMSIGSMTNGVSLITTGNVGIGTTSPAVKLEIASSGNDFLTLRRTNASNSQQFNINVESNSQTSISYDSASPLVFGTSTNPSVQTGFSEKMRITSGGNVGIGITDPSQKLEVSNNILLGKSVSGQTATPSYIDLGNNYSDGALRSKLKIYLYNSGTEQYGFSVGPSGDVQYHSNILHDFYVANSLTLRINGSGNVGINTTTPYDKLEVNGAIAATGASTANASQGHATIINVSSGTSYLTAVDWGAEYKPLVVEGKTLSLQTGTGSTTSRLYIDNSGNVGIGTTAPDNKLVVAVGKATASFNTGITILSGDGSYTTGDGGMLQWTNEDVITAGIRGSRDPGSWASALSFYTHTSGTGNTFNTTFTEKMRITHDGYVGIGTTSPLTKLHVVTNAVSGRQAMSNIDRTTANWVRFTNPEYSTLASMGLLLRVFPDSDLRQGAGIIATGGTNNGTTDLDIFVTTSPDGLGGTSYSAIKINGLNGNVGIGTTNPSYKLDVSGSIQLTTGVNASSLNELFFADNGQIRSADNNHRIIFDRTSNILELREYGSIVLSPGATAGNRTSTVVVNDTGITIGSGSAIEYFVQIGHQRTGNGYAYIDLIGDATYTDYGLRIIRGNTGANATSVITHRGTGEFTLATEDAAAMNFNTNGSVRMYINSSGNVGIGTTNPTVKLDVVSSGGSGMRIIDSTAPNFYINNTVAQWKLYLPASSNDFRINDAVGDYVTIKYNSGNVGIGTTNPAQRLDVSGSALIGPSGGKMFIGDVGHGTTYPAIAHQNYATITEYALLAPSDGYLFLNKRDVPGTYIGFRKANADLVVIDNSGNVGINTTSPGYKLDVRGGNGFINSIILGDDSTYGAPYKVVGFNSVNDGGNRIVAASNNTDGMYFMAATGRGFAFRPNGGTSDLFVINSSGNVGINTTSPTHVLDITTNTTGNAAGSTIRINRPDSVSYENAINWATNGTNYWFLGSDNDSTNNFYLYNWARNAFELTILSGSGNVGIGTTNPGAKLDVAGNITLTNASNPTFTFSSNDSAIINRTGASTGLYFQKAGSTQFMVDSNGNIGINTTSPNAKLDVNGNAIVTGSLNVTSTITGSADMLINGITIGRGKGNVATNVVMGNEALFLNTTGDVNVAIGNYAGYANIIGYGGVFVGWGAGNTNNANNNVALGYRALFSNDTGADNISIGSDSLYSSTGAQNIAIGSGAGTVGTANTTGANNIFIGYRTAGVSATESNRTWIGNSSTTSTWLGGNLLLGQTSNDGRRLQVNGSAVITGSLTVTEGITGSLAGTASWALNVVGGSTSAGGGEGSIQYNASNVITGGNSFILSTGAVPTLTLSGSNGAIFNLKGVEVNGNTHSVIRFTGADSKILSDIKSVYNGFEGRIEFATSLSGSSSPGSSGYIFTPNGLQVIKKYTDSNSPGNFYIWSPLSLNSGVEIYTSGLGSTSGYSISSSIMVGTTASVAIGNSTVETSRFSVVGNITGSLTNPANNITSIARIVGPTGSFSSHIKLITDSGSVSNTVFVVDTAGRVAVNKSTPSQQVDIAGNSVITGSLVVSGSNGAGIFSQGATLVDYVTGISNSGSYMVWRAPFSCSVVAAYGYREGGGPAKVNAVRSGSSGFGLITATDTDLTSANTWVAFGSLQNTTFNAGDTLKLIMSGSASNNQLAVQVDFIRKF